MNRTSILLSLAAILAAVGAYRYVIQANDHPPSEHEKSHEHAGEEDEHNETANSTTITPEAAKASAIATDQVGPQSLRETVALNGKIILNPETSADIRARFPGVIRSVEKAVGQPVTKGETIARVESNDSLQTYSVTSPLSGIVISRNLNVGDTAADQPLLTVANLGSVVAELHVFPQDLPRMRIGQTVLIQTADGHTQSEGIVKALLPTADATTQTVIAWVLLKNESNSWRPGMVVHGGAVIKEEEVPLAVRNEALQTLNNSTVVFVAQGETYTARPVTTGLTDGVYTQVTQGLKAGETYVTTNSFIVKADIGKAGAEHAH